MKDSLQEAIELNARLVERVQVSHQIRRHASFQRPIVDCPAGVGDREPGWASARPSLPEVVASTPIVTPADRIAPTAHQSIYNRDFRKRFSWGLAVAVGMGGVLQLLDKAGLLSMPQ